MILPEGCLNFLVSFGCTLKENKSLMRKIIPFSIISKAQIMNETCDKEFSQTSIL